MTKETSRVAFSLTNAHPLLITQQGWCGTIMTVVSLRCLGSSWVWGWAPWVSVQQWCRLWKCASHPGRGIGWKESQRTAVQHFPGGRGPSFATSYWGTGWPGYALLCHAWVQVPMVGSARTWSVCGLLLMCARVFSVFKLKLFLNPKGKKASWGLFIACTVSGNMDFFFPL